MVIGNCSTALIPLYNKAERGPGAEELWRWCAALPAGRHARWHLAPTALLVYPALAVTVGGRLYTWGYGLDLQLGHGDPGNRPVPTLIGAGAFGERRW